jgi:spore maturation protein A
MLNIIWLGMLITAVIVGAVQGQLDAVVQAVTDSAKQGFDIALHLVGIMSLWLGIMNIASESGLVTRLARLMQPLMSRLFPDVPADHPAMGAMIMNISANVLGLANAATPFGLQAMKELQRLNQNAHAASNAMCTFLAINTSSVQLIPVTAIAYLSANGATHPTDIIFTALLATIASTVVAIIAVKTMERWRCFRVLPDTLPEDKS